MVSVNTLCKNILNVKNTVVEDSCFYSDPDGVKHIRIKARPNKWHGNDCPFCHKPCPVYDRHSRCPRTWRGLDAGGILVEVEYQTHRIRCPEHGVYVADVPWDYPCSGFTKEFDLTVAWLATYLPGSTVSEYMRVDWQTVGNCVNRALNDLEPEQAATATALVGKNAMSGFLALMNAAPADITWLISRLWKMNITTIFFLVMAINVSAWSR